MSIIEIDGPPMAYFWDKGERNVYKTIAVMGKSPTDIVEAMEDSVQAIRDALIEGIIYWRRRPGFVDLDLREADGFYRVACRVTTSRQLSREFWDSLPYVKEEGACIEVLNDAKD